MELLYISTFLFKEKQDGVYALPSCADVFFSKYLDVFDRITVLGEPIKTYLDENALVRINDSRITVKIIKSNTSPRDFIYDHEVKKKLTEEIKKAKAILIKPASRRGMMAIKIANRLNVPYMIEMTGDIHNALRQHPNPLKRAYAPILYHQIKKSIKDCKFGLYVSESYLQSQFPIKGKMCGCADCFLKELDEQILKNRLTKIDQLDPNKKIDLALIGFYQGTMKGVDTAIRALSLLPSNYHLSILGNGTEENRRKWLKFGEAIGIKDRIHFPDPFPSSDQVMQWIDSIDIFVFPTKSEGFGRVVAEAISRGCPTLATDICTMPELLSKECLFPLNDEKRLAEMVDTLIHDKTEMKRIANLNFEHSKNYEYSILCKRRNDFLFEFKKYCEERF